MGYVFGAHVIDWIGLAYAFVVIFGLHVVRGR